MNVGSMSLKQLRLDAGVTVSFAGSSRGNIGEEKMNMENFQNLAKKIPCDYQFGWEYLYILSIELIGGNKYLAIFDEN